ncbi:fimbrial protein [Ralstonia sp. 24A2]|uniref:fimbrial protein n=1 Tax=Ralstonia sp. 24A2 TaxID=3447364 RepID=UPI003F69852C
MLIKRMMYGLSAVAALHVSHSAYAVTCVGGNYVTQAFAGNIADRGLGSLGTYTAVPQGTPWTARCTPGGTPDSLVLTRTGGFGGTPDILLLNAATNRYGFRVRYGTTILSNPGGTTGTRSVTIGTFATGGTPTYTSGASAISVEVIKLRNDGTTFGLGALPVAQARFASNSTIGYNVYINVTTIAPPTCSTGASITIPLGDVLASSLTAAAPASPVRGPVNVALACTAAPRVTMTLQGTPVTGTTDVLPLTNVTNVARGVGVRLFYRPQGTTTNTVLIPGRGVSVSTAAADSLSVPILAQYYRTGNVVAGAGNASPILRFDYD